MGQISGHARPHLCASAVLNALFSRTECGLYSAALVSSMSVFRVTAVRPSASSRTRRVRSAAEGASAASAKAAKRARSASVNEPLPSLAMSLRPYANAAW